MMEISFREEIKSESGIIFKVNINPKNLNLGKPDGSQKVEIEATN